MPADLAKSSLLTYFMLTVAIGSGLAQAQSEDRFERAKLDRSGTQVLADTPRVLEPAVTFLSSAPEIDGRLDRDLVGLPVRAFTRVWKSDAVNPDVTCHYRLAYGAEFFYVYLEAEAGELAFRDRAYQNGDGFAMLIAGPTPDDEPTEEFYVLACSAVNKPELEWTRHVFWYYNVDTIFLTTSEGTRLEFQAADGRISFELLLPWKDVRPYHPWISPGIGFNLSFVKAVGDRERTEHKVHPGTIGAENMPRWYARLRFEEPAVAGAPQTFVAPARGNLSAGAAWPIVAVTAAAEGITEEIVLEAKGAAQSATADARAQYACTRGLTRFDFEAFPAGLASDEYRLQWRAVRGGVGGGEWEVTVLPEFDAGAFLTRLSAARAAIAPGSATTLEFSIGKVASLLADLPPYEVASYERKAILRIDERLQQVERAEDPYARLTGYIRRAFRSPQDGTLQPYVVRVPADYDPSRTYPLIVYLHGSASDEQDICGHPFISRGNAIEVGPYGRGPSNGFDPAEAQIDIAEAIEDVQANYSIDGQRIVLTGFSMGGYGALRTFYETPEKFRAVAVFSGSPFWEAEGAPDFREARHLEPFRGAHVFVYHGQQDRNVRFDRIAETVAQLRAVGTDVEFLNEPDKGHEEPSDATIAKYHEWLDGVLAGATAAHDPE